MTKLLYDIEDYLEDVARAEKVPTWMRWIVRTLGRTVGEAGDIVAARSARF